MVLQGDLKLDGITNLADAFILHEPLAAAGSEFRFDRLGNAPFVPEPATAAMVGAPWLLRVRL